MRQRSDTHLVTSAGEDRRLDIRTPQMSTHLLLVPRTELSPREAEQLLTHPLLDSFRAEAGHVTVLVVAPYLSPRTREAVEAAKAGYLDLTGNIHLEVRNPTIFLHTDGAQRAPRRTRAGSRGLRGAVAGAIVRALAETRPPVQVTELAAAIGVDPGYTSRVVGALEDEALVERDRSRAVVGYDWSELLRRRAEAVRLMDARVSQYLAPSGPRSALDAMAKPPADVDPLIVTGSFAASQYVQVAAPTLLTAYHLSLAADELAALLGLLPTDTGGDVVLIRAQNRFPAVGAQQRGDNWFAGLTQIVVDCLSGPGRMPAEGEALLEWMAANEDTWRVPAVDELHTRTPWLPDE
ncbi:MAG: helix-turn-helix domain-containing protein [Nitriliruptorales bacterium]